MSLFFKAIVDFKNTPVPTLWKVSEGYFSLRNKSFQVDSAGEKKVTVVSVDSHQPFVIKALKVASYFSVVVPLFLLAARTYYRNKYQVELSESGAGTAASVAKAASPVFPLTEIKPPDATTAATVAEASSPIVAAPEVEPLSRIPPTNNDLVIERIKEARAAKPPLKVALFMGRGDDQSVPIEPGWLWVSLDHDMKEKPNKDHPHLKMDFNNLPSTIAGKFDKVVVDFSVLKFLTGISGECWKVLHALAAPGKDSIVYAEAMKGGHGSKELGFSKISGKKIEYEFVPASGTLTLDYSIPKGDSRIAIIKKECLAAQKKYLSDLFESVELLQNQSHRHRDEGEADSKSDYWVLTGKRQRAHPVLNVIYGLAPIPENPHT